MIKLLRLSLFLLAFAALWLPNPGARAQDTVSFDYFYDSLAPYGDWVKVDDYGLCWQPSGVDADWNPYTDGYWAYTDAGWTWVSYEDFGGIVYHYGRWLHLDGPGWCWVPDYEWAPAWVSWRYGNDYVGWAPLPPWARWRRDVGISIWADREYDLGPDHYRFCRVQDFGAPVLRAVVLDPGQNVTIMLRTENITNITYNSHYAGGSVIFNGGPDFAAVNRLATRPIPALKLVQNTAFNPGTARGARPGGPSFAARTVGNQLIVAAPHVAAPADPAALASKAKRTFSGNKVSKGWATVKSPDVQNELRQKVQQQSKGLTPATAPAHAVGVAALSVVPAKADPHAKPAAATNPEKPQKAERNVPAVTSSEPPPGNVPPPSRSAGSTPLKPFTSIPPEEKSHPQTPVTEPRPAVGTAGGTAPKDPRGEAQAQARIRAEQERAAQQRRAQELPPQARPAQERPSQERPPQERAAQERAAQQKQAEIAAGQQGKARGHVEEVRPVQEKQRPPDQRPPETRSVPQPETRGRGNAPAASPQPGAHSKDGKDGKDKDKDRGN